ncbi:hypothetical protein [Streptomyces sp. MBT28]|uniref:hypothetical protein n=1 Tax=Streptomyces sp. MBT28 TaxID=1488357 RepID=UPI000A952809|nr:hypothetical protein [Streptomyces sp. MBT28]
MATDTVPAAVPGPPDPPGNTATTGSDPKGFLASMVAPVEPARPTFSLDPATPATAAADGALDRSAPGVTSTTFRDTTEQAAKDKDPAGTKYKRSIWKEMWLAAATRWAKGGGAANKRLDLAKARAQAHQVKEARTTTVTKSGGLPVRNSGGSGSGMSKGSKNSGGGSSGKGPVNSSGNRSNGAVRNGSGGSSGGRGHGGSGAGGGPGGSNRSGAGGRGGKDTGSSGKSGPDSHRGGGTGGGTGKGPVGGDKHTVKKTDSPTPSRKGTGKKQSPAAGGGASGSGTAGGAGKPGTSGKDGAHGKPATGTDSKNTGHKTDLTKTPKNDNSKNTGTTPRNGKHPASPNGKQTAPEKTPLQKSRETGHGDGTKARRIVDHVKAYTDGARDGWGDEKTRNAQEHDRLDKAHTAHKPTTSQPASRIITEKGDDGVTTDVKPLTVQSIDANTLTLAAGDVRTTVGRRELRNFKQYERKLEAKTDTLQKIAEACKQLAAEAEAEAKDCQHLAEQAKSVKGGEKCGATLDRLAEQAKSQATEAGDLAQRARKAAEMCKVVLTNIQTRYQPLYKAVVDSDETKPAELRFYNDKGTYAPAA